MTVAKARVVNFMIDGVLLTGGFLSNVHKTSAESRAEQSFGGTTALRFFLQIVSVVQNKVMAGSLSAKQLQRHTWNCCTRQEDLLPEPRELARTVWQILGNADCRNQSKAPIVQGTMSIVPFDSLPRMRTPSDVRLLDANSQLCICIPAKFT